MKHLKNFNENNNPEEQLHNAMFGQRKTGKRVGANNKIPYFISNANKILDDETYSNVDIMSELGDLAETLNMSSEDIQKVIASNKIKNDPHNFIKGLLDETLNGEQKTSDEDTLLSMIEDHISSEVYLRDVPYSMQDGAQELDPDSVKDAANAIVKMLKEKGIL